MKWRGQICAADLEWTAHARWGTAARTATRTQRLDQERTAGIHPRYSWPERPNERRPLI